MGKSNKDTATEAVAVLKSIFEAAELALNAIPETAAPEEKAEAINAFEEAKKAYETAIAPKPPKEKEEKVKIEFTVSPTAKFKLGYNVGEKATFLKLQADELIEAGYAKLAK